MGLGGMAKFGFAWLDAKQEERDRLLQLMKDVAGVGEATARRAETLQQIELREVQDKRVQQLFGPKLTAAKAVAGQEVTRGKTMERTEAEQVAAIKAVTAEYEKAPETLRQLEESGELQQAIDIIEEKTGLQFAKLTAGLEVQEKVTARRAAEIADMQQKERVRAGVLPAVAISEKEKAFTEADEAKFAREELAAARAEELPAKKAKAAGALAEATEQQARVREEIDKYKRFGMENAAEIVANAEVYHPEYVNDLLMEQAKTEQAKQKGVAKPETEMQLLERLMGPEQFAYTIIKSYNLKAGIEIKPADLNDNIQQALTSIANIQAKLTAGEAPGIMELLLAQALEKNPGAAVMFMNKDRAQIPPEEIIRGLEGYIRVQKRLLSDQGFSYSQLLLAGLSEDVYDMGSVDDIIRRIEANQAAPGTIGDDARLYGTGATPARRTDVISRVLKVLNHPDINPIYWERSFVANRELLKSKAGWSEQDINAAISILRSLLNLKLQPGQLPLPAAAAGGAVE